MEDGNQGRVVLYEYVTFGENGRERIQLEILRWLRDLTWLLLTKLYKMADGGTEVKELHLCS